MRTIASGAKWMVLLRVFDRICGLASTLVLARLLTPSDFGIVAMATSVIALFELVTAFGFDVVLIQKTNPERRDFDSAWTLSILLYCSCGLLIGLSALPTAAFYKEPRLVIPIIVIGLGWMLRGFENIGTVEFRRQMDFGKEFAYSAGIRIASLVVTVMAALLFRSYWGLIVGVVTSRLVGLALSYIMSPYRPRLDLSAARDLLSFSRWLLINNATLVGVVRFPHFLIGRVLGSQALGLFTVAYDLGTMPATELSSPVNRAALPGYSRLLHDKPRLKETFLDIGGVVLALALPISAGLVIVAEPVVIVLLGQKWIGAVPILRVLALSALLVAAAGNNGVGHFALGIPRAVTAQSILRLVILVSMSLVLTPVFGLLGVAIAELSGVVACLLASYPIVFKRLDISVLEYVERIWRPVVATLGMASVTWTLHSSIARAHDTASALVTLAVDVPAGVATYFFLITAIWWFSGRPRGSETILVNHISGVFRFGRMKHFSHSSVEAANEYR